MTNSTGSYITICFLIFLHVCLCLFVCPTWTIKIYFLLTGCLAFLTLKVTSGIQYPYYLCVTPVGYSSEFSVGVCRPVLQIRTQFQTKTCHFPRPFSDLASKIHIRFQTSVVPKLSFKSVIKSRIGKIQLEWYVLDTSLSLLFIWSWKDKIAQTLPWFIPNTPPPPPPPRVCYIVNAFCRLWDK